MRSLLAAILAGLAALLGCAAAAAGAPAVRHWTASQAAQYEWQHGAHFSASGCRLLPSRYASECLLDTYTATEREYLYDWNHDADFKLPQCGLLPPVLLQPCTVAVRVQLANPKAAPESYAERQSYVSLFLSGAHFTTAECALLPAKYVSACVATAPAAAPGSAAVPQAPPSPAGAPRPVRLVPSLHVGLAFDASVFLRPGTTAPATPHGSTPCLAQPYATFEFARALNAAGAPVGTYRPAGSPVTFLFPPTAGRDALCVPLGGSVRIPVPSGRYAAAEFLASTAFGPAQGIVRADYAGGDQGVDIVTFPDWCVPGPGVAGWVGQPRVIADSGALDTNRCGVFVEHVALDGGRTLRALEVALPAADAGGEPGLTVTNILALSLERTGAGSPAG